MLVHGRTEIVALAEHCVIVVGDDSNGWHVDAWRMDDDDVAGAVAVYAAVLGGGVTDPVVALLEEEGLDLEALLIDTKHGKDDITRSDLTELAAAASLVAAPGCDIDRMHMPNVPKMSRRKSDSGVDIFVAILSQDADLNELQADEGLTIVSVKHTIDDKSAGGMRWKLADSLSNRELSIPYLASQLRVLNARMRQEGLAIGPAARIYLFLRDFPDHNIVDLFAIGVVDPDLEDDLSHQIELLPEADQSNRTFRMILMPGLRNVHERCP